jgi:hypothetical protein
MSYSSQKEIDELKALALAGMQAPSPEVALLRRELQEVKEAKELIANNLYRQLKSREDEVQTLAKMLDEAHRKLDSKPTSVYMSTPLEELPNLSTFALFTEIDRLRSCKPQWNAADVARYEFIVDLLAEQGVILALV